VKIGGGLQDWQIVQQNERGTGDVELHGTWLPQTDKAKRTVYVRVVNEDDRSPVSRTLDWHPAETATNGSWRAKLSIPRGGLYRVETLLRTGDLRLDWNPNGEAVAHVGVGDIWVIAGQSNAVGYGHGAVVDPPMLGVSVFGGDEVWRLATHPIFDPTETRHPANRDGGWVDVSPWLAFGTGIFTGAGVPVGLIPAALGGSPLSAWDPGNPEGAYLYENMLSLIDAAGGRVAGMAWYQGESDANAELAATYLARFTRFVAAFRARCGAGLPVLTAQLNRYFDSADPAQGRAWSAIREAQRRAARAIPGVAAVPTLDLGLSDAIHTSAVGNVVLGERFARVALGMVYGQALNWRPADARDARFLDDGRAEVAITFDHVRDHLVLLTLFAEEFTVEDAVGAVPVAKAWVEEPNVVRLTLGRAAGAGAVCHLSAGCNPPSTLRDALQRPALAYYGLEILAS